MWIDCSNMSHVQRWNKVPLCELSCTFPSMSGVALLLLLMIVVHTSRKNTAPSITLFFPSFIWSFFFLIFIFFRLLIITVNCSTSVAERGKRLPLSWKDFCLSPKALTLGTLLKIYYYRSSKKERPSQVIHFGGELCVLEQMGKLSSTTSRDINGSANLKSPNL